MQLFFGTYKNIKTHKWLALKSVGLAYSCSSTPPVKISHGHLFTILCASGFAALNFSDHCDVSLMRSETSTKTEYLLVDGIFYLQLRQRVNSLAQW